MEIKKYIKKYCFPLLFLIWWQTIMPNLKPYPNMPLSTQHHCEKPGKVIGRLFEFIHTEKCETAFARNPLPAPVMGRLIDEFWRAVADLCLKIL
jgi:hypothetical protein